jgi:nickel-dependent lactate racemase
MAELGQNSVQYELTGIDEVRRALKEPVGTPKLSEIVKPGEKAVIITSDITRPMPSRTVLPAVMEELLAAGAQYKDITVVFALGSHRKHTEEEKRYLVGDDIYEKVTCIDSDVNNAGCLGPLPAGHLLRYSMWLRRRPCHLSGKYRISLFRGLQRRSKSNNAGSFNKSGDPGQPQRHGHGCCKGRSTDDNPVRLDIDEVTRFVKIDFILNVVLDENKNIIKAVAGHYFHAHREGCRFLDGLYKVKIPEKADIVITTPGGFPKDINLYQAQKALDNAKHAVRDGGIIILLASCTEGYGESVFERWIKEASSVDDLVTRIKSNFELGGHKAAAIALVEKKAKVFIVSDMECEMAEKLFMEPFSSMDEALNKAFKEMGQDARVLLMPHGGSTLPVVQL